jgi:threonine dehydrogenase-like Zn-dependent dehydrogenase
MREICSRDEGQTDGGSRDEGTLPVGRQELCRLEFPSPDWMRVLARCADLVAPGGSVVVLGVHMVSHLPVPWYPLFRSEATLVPSLGYCAHGGRKEIAEAADLLAARPEVADTLITHRFALDDAVEAFRVASDRSTGAIRVVLET